MVYMTGFEPANPEISNMLTSTYVKFLWWGLNPHQTELQGQTLVSWYTVTEAACANGQ